MQANVKKVRALGRLVAEAQDEVLSKQDSLREARALWLSPARAPTRAPRTIDWPFWAFAAIATTLTAAAWLDFWVRTPGPALAFRVGPSEELVAGAQAMPGVVGELIAAPVRQRLPIHFSDGSLVRLDPAARARIVEVADRGSRILLESGMAHASIVHHADTRWSVQAGPFDVRVTGTQFDVAWDPPRGLFTITLLEGRVAVSGCSMGEARNVATGETFRATCKSEEPQGIPTASPSPSSSPAASPSPAAMPAASPSLPTLPRVTPARPTWRELLALHRYAEASEAADAAGLSSICASTDILTLMDLSDAARFAGHVDHAKLILEEVRRRFAGDERASTAAFNLGRVAFDDEAAYAEAARWFDVYLLERSGGPLAREASGRRMEALERSGDHAAAKDAAKHYLDDFPAGPHSELARSIAGR